MAMSILILGVFSGSRYEMGGYDYSVYQYIYDLVPNSPLDVLFGELDIYLVVIEKGYLLLNSIFKALLKDFNFMFLLFGVASASLLILSLRLYSKYVFLSIIIFLGTGYLYYYFTAQRQVMAMMISWFGLQYIFAKSFKKYLLSICIAAVIHSSALFMVPMYFILNRVYKTKSLVSAIAISFMLGLSGLLTKGLELISRVIPFGDKLYLYVSKEASSINVLNYVETIPILFFIVYYRSLLSLKSPYFNMFFNAMIFSAILLFGFYNFAIIMRVKDYLSIGYLVVLPLFVDCFKDRKQKVLYISLITIYFFLVYARHILTFDQGDGFLPYKNFILNQ